MNREELLKYLWQEQTDYYTLMTEYENIQYRNEDIVMNDSEVYILKIIGMNRNITTTEIASQVRKTASAVSQIVKKLIKKDLVKQERNIENRRIYNLSLSELGEKLFEDSISFDRKGMFTIFSSLSEFSDEELKTYVTIQKKMKEAYEEDLLAFKNAMIERSHKQ